MARSEKTNTMILTALMMCIILIATFAIRIPAPGTSGYLHLGDAMIYLGVLLLGRKNGAAAAGLGSALADLLGGYAIYAPWTLIIKALMAYICASVIERAANRERHYPRIFGMPLPELAAMVLGGIVMVAGYMICDAFLAGNLMAGVIGMAGNAGQCVAGIIVCTVLSKALYKTPAKNLFCYRIDEMK